jgi:hypothetical protein
MGLGNTGPEFFNRTGICFILYSLVLLVLLVLVNIYKVEKRLNREL